MNTKFHQPSLRGARSGLPLTLFILLVLGAATASAQTVNCAESASLNAVLAGLDRTVQNTVVISGVCKESVVADGFRDLTLSGTDGAVIERPSGSGTALEIRSSGVVRINGLTFRAADAGGQPLVRVSNSNVEVSKSSFLGSPSDGLVVTDSSTVYINGSTFQNNTGAGISVSGRSSVTISAWGPTDLTLIQKNGTGLGVGGGGSATVGNVTIKDNGTGVGVGDSETVALGTWGGPAPTISGNGNTLGGSAAVSIGKGGIVWITPFTAIQDNPSDGVLVEYGGQAIVCCGNEGATISHNEGHGIAAWMGGQVFFWGAGVLEENRKGGLSLHSSSHAHLGGAGTVIRRNGDPADVNSYGGIRVEMNSVVLGTSALTVSDNYGPGVFVRAASTARFVGNTAISGNRGYGVQLEMNASAEFGDNDNVAGNKRFDLLCTAGSVAGAVKGARPTIGKMNCPDWSQLTPRPAWEQ